MIKTGMSCREYQSRGNNFINKKDPDWMKYFFFMGRSEREAVLKWYKIQNPKTAKQKRFLIIVRKALDTVHYDYRIATIEPARDGNRLYYEKFQMVCTTRSYWDWKEMAETFAPEYGSQLATLDELFLWYAFRIAMGYWTLEYVADDSSCSGNYINAPLAGRRIELSAQRKVGGFADGIGNLKKIVRNSNGRFFQCGGHFRCSGIAYPVAEIRGATMMGISFCSAVLVLKK